MVGIYAITNIETTPETIYFGQSENIERRIKGHKYTLIKQNHRNRYLQRAWNKYSKGAFIFATFRLLDSKDALTYWEKHAIQEAKELGMRVYNIAEPDKPPMTGRHHSLKTKKILSKKSKGNKNSLGWVPSKEWREKISASNKGRKHSEETKKKISKSSTGRIFSLMARRKMSENAKGNQHWLGKKHSEQSKKKMSLAVTGRVASEETKKKISFAASHISDETRKKMSLAKQGKIPWNKDLVKV